MMNDLMRAWIDELRTTDVPQTRGYLNRVKTGRYDAHTPGLCCLGVACEVMLKTPGFRDKLDKQEYTPSTGGTLVQYNGEAGVLPKIVKQALELRDANPTIVVDNIHYEPKEDNERVNAEITNTLGQTIRVVQYSNPRRLVDDTLSSLNDRGFTFDQIADLIEYAGLE